MSAKTSQFYLVGRGDACLSERRDEIPSRKQMKAMAT